jgi:hypothetical protein
MLREPSPGAPEWCRGDIIQLTAPRLPVLKDAFLVVLVPNEQGGVGYLSAHHPDAVDLVSSFYGARFDEGVLCGRVARISVTCASGLGPIEQIEEPAGEVLAHERAAHCGAQAYRGEPSPGSAVTLPAPAGDRHRWGDGA